MPFRCGRPAFRVPAEASATSAYLLLAAPEHHPFGDQLISQKVLPKDVAIQRVMWHPAIDKLKTGTTVTARVKRGPGRRAVIILPDSTRIWPAGRLRRRLPRMWLLTRRGLSPQSPRLWPSPFFTPAAAVAGLKDQGKSLGQIAAKTGIPKTSLHRYLANPEEVEKTGH